MTPHRELLSPGAADLDDVLITDDLSGRAPRPPDYEAENRALVHLARAMVDSPWNILQMLAETALDLCYAETAGISLLEWSDPGEEIFCWRALAGANRSQLGGTTPRGFSPCGDGPRSAHPPTCSRTRHCTSRISGDVPPIHECLLIPFFIGSRPVGTIWAMTYDDIRTFDAEDLRNPDQSR